MAGKESTLAMVQRHVREGAEHVARQRELLAHLRNKGLPTENAAALLISFEDIQQQHEAHLAWIVCEQDEPGKTNS